MRPGSSLKIDRSRCESGQSTGEKVSIYGMDHMRSFINEAS